MSPDQAPHPQAMDSLDLEFFLEDLKDFTHISLCSPNTLAHFTVHYSFDDKEIVYKLS